MILDLRAAREERDLSISKIMDLLKTASDKTGAALPSETSVRSVMTGDLEKISGFSYESTLLPLKAVLRPKENDALCMERIAVILDVLRMQEETIARLTVQLREAEAARHERCRKCAEHMDFYKSQIKLKDNRMERKDRWIAQLLKLPEDEEA